MNGFTVTIHYAGFSHNTTLHSAAVLLIVQISVSALNMCIEYRYSI